MDLVDYGPTSIMGKKSELGGAQLTAVVAVTVFGWKHVHAHQGRLIGKKQDKAGRWRTAKVPDYAGDATQAYAIEERMRQLGKATAYLKEVARMTKAKKLPVDWATPEQRSLAAVAVLGSKREKK